MMLDRMEGNAELKSSVQLMLAARRLTHSVLLVGEEGLGAGFAARCIAADYLYPAGGAPAEALLRGECCRAVGKPGDRDSGHVETGIVREAISVSGMGAGGKYLAYKPAAICASARRAGTTTTLDQLVKYPEFFHMPLVSGSYWPMVHGSKPEQVLEDEEGCAVMRELGRNMAWLLKCIELGKANGITHPENPRRPMTNFIR